MAAIGAAESRIVRARENRYTYRGDFQPWNARPGNERFHEDEYYQYGEGLTNENARRAAFIAGAESFMKECRKRISTHYLPNLRTALENLYAQITAVNSNGGIDERAYLTHTVADINAFVKKATRIHNDAIKYVPQSEMPPDRLRCPTLMIKQSAKDTRW
jgi:hypothetical protein